MLLNILNNIPNGLLDCDVSQVHDLLGGPSLLHLNYQKEKTLFLSVLLHGNETSSFYALQKFLSDQYTKKKNLIIFIGNTEAAKHNQRVLEGQTDYNRIWDLTGESKEHQVAKELCTYLEGIELFAAIDMHNNTGKNPLYGCVNFADPKFLHLASLFSHDVVFFKEPHSVLSNNFAGRCPSITVEAGLSGNSYGVTSLIKLLKRAEQLEELDDQFHRSQVNLYHTVARIKIDPKLMISFKEDKKGLCFISDFDELNFQTLNSGLVLAKLIDVKESEVFKYFNVLDDQDMNVTETYFRVQENQLVVNKEFIASMFTKQVHIVYEDCLGYIMEDYN